MIRVSDRGHPFFKPLWRRILVTALVIVWAAFEFLFPREPMWMVLSGGLVAYSVWVFFLTWPKDEDAGVAPTETDAPSPQDDEADRP